MFDPTLFISPLSSEYIDQEVANANKCEISGIIKKIEIEEYDECISKVKIYIYGNNGYYEFFSFKTIENLCEIDGSSIIYSDETLPKVGDNVNYLINKDGYYIISNEKVGEGIYKLISGNNSKGSTHICVQNSNFIEFYNEYLYYGIIICFLIIIGIVVNMIRGKNK